MMGLPNHLVVDLENSMMTVCHLGFYSGMMMGRLMEPLNHLGVDLEHSTKMAHHLELCSGSMME
jgi:hypothetical protein